MLLFAAVALGLMKWSELPGHHVPKWVLVVATLPVLCLSYLDDDSDDDSALHRFFGLFSLVYFLGASIFLMVVGYVGFSLGGSDSLGELLSFALPVGALGLIFVVAKIWMDSR